MTREFHIAADDAGLRLDHFLAARAEGLSRSRLQALIASGHITLNRASTRPGAKVRAGDVILLNVPAAVATENVAQDIPLAVLFEDDDLLVIDKPAGLVVHPAAGNPDGTLVNALLHHCEGLSGIGGVQRPGIVHRLDKETSGCLVVAKHDRAHQALAAQFARREVTKIYLALVSGGLPTPAGTIEQPIGRHPIHRQQMAVVAKGRPARTSWRVLGKIPGGSIVECTLHTGRTHQIRVHLKHLGHPLLGDDRYGKRGSFSRQMLHAWRLGFIHPRSGERINFESPIPADFVEAGCPPTFR